MAFSVMDNTLFLYFLYSFSHQTPLWHTHTHTKTHLPLHQHTHTHMHTRCFPLANLLPTPPPRTSSSVSCGNLSERLQKGSRLIPAVNLLFYIKPNFTRQPRVTLINWVSTLSSSAPLPVIGGGQKTACNLEGRRILIRAFKAGKDRDDNLTLISILSTGGKKRKGKRKVLRWWGEWERRPRTLMIVLLSLVFRYISSGSLLAPDLFLASSAFTN